MKEKCSKFEGLFTFADEITLLEHIAVCEDCKREFEKMTKVSSLIQEVKPFFKKKKRDAAKMRAVCAISLMLLSTATLGVINLNTDIHDTIKYGRVLGAEDLGFPVDTYGFLMVD